MELGAQRLGSLAAASHQRSSLARYKNLGNRWSVKCRPPGLQAAGTSAHWALPVSLAGAAWSPLPGTGSRSLVPNFSGSLWLQRTPSERARSFFAW